MKYLRTKKKLVGTALIATMLVAITPNIAMADNASNIRMEAEVQQQKGLGDVCTKKRDVMSIVLRKFQLTKQVTVATESDAIPKEVADKVATTSNALSESEVEKNIGVEEATASNAIQEAVDKATDMVPKIVPLGVFKTTGYCPCRKCCGKYKTTATGTIPLANHTIAVDPRIIPYGSKILINGVVYIAEDCGGGVKRNHIDIFYPNHTIARYHGVQYAQVFLVVG